MLRLIKARGCQRCGGSLSLERDEYGAYIACIQCGAVWNQPETPAKPAAESRCEPAGPALTGSRR